MPIVVGIKTLQVDTPSWNDGASGNRLGFASADGGIARISARVMHWMPETGRASAFAGWRHESEQHEVAEPPLRNGRIREREIPLMHAIVLFVLSVGVVPLACAADLTADQVRALLAASQDKPVDLTGKDLSDLDLSNVDFKRADLSRANLFAARLASSNLAGAKLARANLNGAWVMGTKFAGADLSESSMLSLVILGGQVKEKPNFAGANLTGVRMIAELAGADLHGANLSRANLGVDIKNQGMGQMRTDLSGANLAGADLQNADLSRSLMMFADLRGANLRGANFYRVRLAGADLSGADIAGADFTEADLERTVFKGVKGLQAARGMDKAANRDKAVVD